MNLTGFETDETVGNLKRVTHYRGKHFNRSTKARRVLPRGL